jgi:hypothetical protein
VTARALPVRALQVIHRPANALKELLENSIDAGSTNISVVAKAGGLKMLQVAAAGRARAVCLCHARRQHQRPRGTALIEL